jgi:hypothetical protein
MLGMEPAKPEIKLIKSTTKESGPRQDGAAGAGDLGPHLVVGGARYRQNLARAFTKQLCGLTVPRTPLVVETSRAQLLGRYMADAEKNTEEMLEGALGGAVFFDEMHTLHERGYRQGDTPAATRSSTPCCCTWRTIVTSAHWADCWESQSLNTFRLRPSMMSMSLRHVDPPRLWQTPSAYVRWRR